VPWEDAVDEAYERKKLRYAHLATEAEQRVMEGDSHPHLERSVNRWGSIGYCKAMS